MDIESQLIKHLYHYVFCYLFELTVALAFTLIFCYTVYAVRSNRNLPPGPWGLPFFGCIFKKKGTGSPLSWYTKQADKYGEIVSLRLGSTLIMCVSSPKVLRNIFNRPDSTNRPHTPLNDLLGGFGIVLSEDPLWKKQRQFLMEKFRFLGVRLWSDQKFEHYIRLEITEFFSILEASEHRPLDPAIMLGRHMHNIICQLMMSFRFEENDVEFTNFNQIVSKGMELYGTLHVGEYLPIIMNLPSKKHNIKKIQSNLDEVSNFHGKCIARRREIRKSFDGHYEAKDLLDCYLDIIDSETKTNGDLFPGVDSDKQIIQVMNDLFSAGMETSRNTLVWTLVMMIRNPGIAAKVRVTLGDVVEPGQLVTLEHRPRLTYVEASIYETLRICYVVPLGTTHVNANDWKVNGYRVPKDTHIIPLINKINMDPKNFPDPDKFMPERFINDEGNLHLPDFFLPFGVGRRICLGDQLAKMEMFLFFANLMNNFTFELPEGQEMPGLNGVVGSTHAAKPFALKFKKYNKYMKNSKNGVIGNGSP